MWYCYFYLSEESEHFFHHWYSEFLQLHVCKLGVSALYSNIDQCCSQDHLKRDQVKTKTSAGPHRVTHNKMRNLQTTGTPKIDVKEPYSQKNLCNQ